MMDREELDHRFKFHPADTDARRLAHTTARESVKELANKLNVLVPDGREKSLAMTKLEEALFWANAAIARAKPTE